MRLKGGEKEAGAGGELRGGEGEREEERWRRRKRQEQGETEREERQSGREAGAELRGGERGRSRRGERKRSRWAGGGDGGEGRASRGESCVLTQFHMQVCLLASLGCLMQSLELKELDYFIIQSQLYPWIAFSALNKESWHSILGSLSFFLGEPDLEMKAMATHSSTLTWKIPWTEEPGRLQSMGSLRVRCD